MTPAERFEVVIFDADDTLWRSEDHFRATAAFFADVVEPYTDPDVDPTEVLHRIELGNVNATGYGVLAYTLSMVEAAATASRGRIPADDIMTLVRRGYEQLRHPVDVLPGVEATLADLGSTHRLMLITKGDLLHQQRKIDASGLAASFERTAVVTDKEAATYDRLLREWNVDPTRTVMIGNSLRSDVLPIMALGGHGVHVPYHVTWAHELVDDHEGTHTTLDSMFDVVGWFRGSTLPT